MKFKDLVDKYTWDDVRPDLLRLYPDEEKTLDSYRRVYASLQALQPVESRLRICIETATNDLDGTTYEDVAGKDGTTRRATAPEAKWDDEQGNEETAFAIELTDWAEWLGMAIDPDTTARYSETDIIGHCLWEMTFFGYTQEKIREFADDLKERAQTAERHTYEDVQQWLDELDEA